MSDAVPSADQPQKLTLVHWLIMSLAAIGFAFDIYELLMLPLVIRPALQEFGVTPALLGVEEFQAQLFVWRSLFFFLPAFVGGIFGLLGGYLTDRLGRRRVLTWSILLYAVSAFLAGFSTSLTMLLILRCTTFIGVCVEFVAAVAWLAELFPNPQQRERVLGYTQAFSSLGGLMVAVAFELSVLFSASLPAISMPGFLTGLLGTIGDGHQHEAWRYTLMSGLIPALPLLIIRPFLPESPVWAKKKEAGTLRRPHLRELFAPGLRRTTIVTTIMFACSYGAAFGAIQQIPQIVPGLADVQEHRQELPTKAQRPYVQKVGAQYTKMQELGGLTGRFLFAILTVYIISRRGLMRIFQVPGLILMPLIFFFFLSMNNQTYFVINLNWALLGEVPVTTVSLCAFLAGLFTVAQFSFWGNYLPRVYPVHLRGTGESFAANIGGRMFGTSFAAVASGLATIMPGETDPARLAFAAAAVALFVYGVGSIACFFLPEPGPEEEMEEE